MTTAEQQSNGTRARRRMSPDERKQEIVSVARELLAKDPHVGLDDLAEAAGVTRQLISLYFPGGGIGPIVALILDDFRDQFVGFLDMAGMLGDVVDFNHEDQFRKAMVQITSRLLNFVDEIGEPWMFSLSRDVGGSGFGAGTEEVHRNLVEGILANRGLGDDPLTKAMYRSEVMAIDSLIYTYSKQELSREETELAIVERFCNLRFVLQPAVASAAAASA